MKSLLQDNRGVAALMTVIIIFAVVLSSGLVVASIAVNELSLNLSGAESHRALQIAEACADEASYRLKKDSAYTGGTLTFPEGDCTAVVTGTGTDRAVTASATVRNSTRRVEMSVSLTSNLSATAEGSDIIDWDES